jgi:putative membrane protein
MKTDKTPDEDKKLIIEKQLHWALERTRLAKERTFAAWLRTGLASAITGLGLVKLLPGLRPEWMGKAIGLLLVFSSALIFVLGFRTYYIVLKKLEKEGFKGMSTKIIGTLAFCFLLVAILAFVIILMH